MNLLEMPSEVIKQAQKKIPVLLGTDEKFDFTLCTQMKHVMMSKERKMN
jgi:hypothetical protein